MKHKLNDERNENDFDRNDSAVKIVYGEREQESDDEKTMKTNVVNRLKNKHQIQPRARNNFVWTDILFSN